MTINYVTDGAWGTGLGRPLEADEADTNIYTLEQAIADLVNNPIPGVSVSNISVNGRQVSFYMTDATVYGPFDLPISNPAYRGVWTPGDGYNAFDIVSVSGYGTYLVLNSHVASGTFDPNAGSSAGDYYVQIGPDPYYTTQALNVSATTLTLSLTHQNNYIRSTNAAGLAVTLPAGVFPPNAEVHFRQAAAGPVSITAGAGVVINAPVGFDLSSNSIGSVFTIKRVPDGALEEWDIFGKLAEVSA